MEKAVSLVEGNSNAESRLQERELGAAERGLHREDNVVVALQLKLGSRLVHGDDIRAEPPEPRVDAYVREVVHTPYFSYRYPAARRRERA